MSACGLSAKKDSRTTAACSGGKALHRGANSRRARPPASGLRPKHPAAPLVTVSDSTLRAPAFPADAVDAAIARYRIDPGRDAGLGRIIERRLVPDRDHRFLHNFLGRVARESPLREESDQPRREIFKQPHERSSVPVGRDRPHPEPQVLCGRSRPRRGQTHRTSSTIGARERERHGGVLPNAISDLDTRTAAARITFPDPVSKLVRNMSVYSSA